MESLARQWAAHVSNVLDLFVLRVDVDARETLLVVRRVGQRTMDHPHREEKERDKCDAQVVARWHYLTLLRWIKGNAFAYGG